MAFLKRKRKAQQLYVAKTEIISGGIDQINGPEYVTVTRYFLVEKRKGEYHEIFSKENLISSINCIAKGVIDKDFDIPVILETKPINEYLYEKEFTDSELFYFINKMNTINQLKELKELQNSKNKEDEEEDEEDEDNTYEEEIIEEEYQ